MGRKKISPAQSRQSSQQRREGSGSVSEATRHFENAAAGEDAEWFQDMAILRQAAADRTPGRMAAKEPFPWVTAADPIPNLAAALESSAAEKQDAIVRSFYEHNPDQAASLLNTALRESSREQRRRIGAALVSSGLVNEAINNLTSEKNKDTYRAFSLLFLVVKAGEIDPLVQLIETHASVDLRMKLIGLLASSGEREILEVFRRLADSKSLPLELRSTIVGAINQLNAQAGESASSAA